MTLVKTIEALGETNSKCFGIVDDDGDRNCNKIKYLRNLFYLKRDGKENYVLDPINVYFYLKSLDIAKYDHLKKNERVQNLFKEISQEFSHHASTTNFTLNSILEIIYSGNSHCERENCVKFLQIILKKFSDLLIKEAVNTIIDKNLNVGKLFRLQYVTHKPKITNSFQSTQALEKYSKMLVGQVKKLEKDKTLKGLFDENMSKHDQSLTSLDENFKHFLDKFNKVGANQEINFDLAKCSSEKAISDTKKGYLQNKLILQASEDSNSAKKKSKLSKTMISLENYFKLKKLALGINEYSKYYHFEEFDDKIERLSTHKRLTDVLTEKRVVYVNRYKLEYSNFFISFDDHELERLYNKVFQCEIKSDKIVEKIATNGFFVPDDMVSMFRGLCTNMHELNEETFKFMVYNTNVSWFVLFTFDFNDSSYLYKA